MFRDSRARREAIGGPRDRSRHDENKVMIFECSFPPRAPHRLVALKLLGGERASVGAETAEFALWKAR